MPTLPVPMPSSFVDMMSFDLYSNPWQGTLMPLSFYRKAEF